MTTDQSRGVLTVIRRALPLLTRRDVWRLSILLAALIVMALLQVVGIGSVLPFLNVLSDPQAIQNDGLLGEVYRSIGFTTTTSFIFFLGAVALIALIGSNAFIALTIWLTTSFTWDLQHRLSRSLLERYLARPYVDFLDRNSADLGKNILIETQRATSAILLPALHVCAFGLSALFIAGFLVWLEPTFAGLVAVVIGGGYVAIYLGVRRLLQQRGQRRLLANTLRFKAVNEAFGGLKETKASGRERQFVRQYDEPAAEFAAAEKVRQVLGVLPRYLMEIMAFGGILVLVLYVLSVRGDVQQVIPIAGVYAFAGYRLMPAIQRIYEAVSQIRFNRPVLDALLADMEQVSGDRPLPDTDSGPTLDLKNGIRLRDVTLTYPGAEGPSLRNIDLLIPTSTWVAFVGETGSGKTTLADVVLGLLRPESGAVFIGDDELTDENLPVWRTQIGYVPQDIFLSDDTVASNIAFGFPPGEIDRVALERAARIANIHDFVIGQLPHGYETSVGEHGVRLSGGQRQRIGIARALYTDPEVLVLDEATSALDTPTAATITDAIERAATQRTVVMVAHRLSTVERCDQIHLLEGGRIVASGTYGQLIASDPRFRAMVGAAG